MIASARVLRRFLAQAVEVVFPHRCVFCGVRQNEQFICAPCALLLPWNKVFCECCGQPLPAEQPEGVNCAQCQLSPPPYVKARAVTTYAYPLDRALKALKFRRQLWYAPAMAELLLPAVQREFSTCDALLPVPLHRWRQARRGFNQATEICRPLAKLAGLRIVTDVQRVKATQPQSGLSATERKRNLQHAFALPALLTCRRPLVVDDVITTGATAGQLANMLLRAGAESVHVLAVARVDQFAVQANDF